MRVFHLLTTGYAGEFKEPTKGRMDEVARFIHNSLFLSHSLRRDVIAKVTLFDGPLAPLTISINGEKVKGLHPDESSILGFLRNAIGRFRKGEAQMPGVTIEKDFKQERGIVLDENGRRENPRANYFYIGGPYGFPLELDLPRYSLGGSVYTASQTVCIVNYLLDVGTWTLE